MNQPRVLGSREAVQRPIWRGVLETCYLGPENCSPEIELTVMKREAGLPKATIEVRRLVTGETGFKSISRLKTPLGCEVLCSVDRTDRDRIELSFEAPQGWVATPKERMGATPVRMLSGGN